MFVLNLLVGVVVAMSLGGNQEQPPVFRSEVYVVPVEISMSRRWLGLFRRPYTDLTLDDVTIVLDDETYPVVELAQDPEKPGHYLLTFTPAPEYRDGEEHLIEVMVRLGSGRPARLPPMQMTFPKPFDESGESEPLDTPVSK